MILAEKVYSSHGLDTLGPLCLWQCFLNQETKAQYARDDPAFLVLLSAVLIVTSAGFSFTLGALFISQIAH